MIFCKELDKSFGTQKEMFSELKANVSKIISVKKAALKYSDPVSYSLKAKDSEKNEVEVQSVKVGDFVYPVINTTNLLDSHGDVHIDGLWDVSVKDQAGRIYYIINHDLKIGSVIAYPEDVTVFLKTFQWSELGKSYPGTTQALVYKVLLTDASNKDALEAIKARKPLQNSVRMQYVQMTLCINDSDDEFKQEYANFYKYLAVIANKEDAMEKGYFWAITQAKISQEGSAVLFGSNSITPILTEQEINLNPSQDSSKHHIDPAKTSQRMKSSLLLT